MLVEPKIEESARKMLGHAIQAELPELETAIDSVGDETYGENNPAVHVTTISKPPDDQSAARSGPFLLARVWSHRGG